MIARVIISAKLDSRINELQRILKEAGFSLSHPDLMYVDAEQKYGVELSKQIREFLSIKPYQAKGKAVVLEYADRLTTEAQNSLLKTLEEPPEHALILLGAENESRLLPTILSRCQVTHVQSHPEFISGSHEEIPKQVGKAPLRVRNDVKGKYHGDIERLESSTIEQRFQFIEKLEEKQEFLHAMVGYYQEKLRKESKYLDFTKKLLEAEKWASANVNIRTILEYLMLEMG